MSGRCVDELHHLVAIVLVVLGWGHGQIDKGVSDATAEIVHVVRIVWECSIWADALAIEACRLVPNHSTGVWEAAELFF